MIITIKLRLIFCILTAALVCSHTWFHLLKHGKEPPLGPLTAGLHTLAQLRLHLAVGPLSRQLRQLAGHGGGGDDGLEAALAFGDVLLGVEDDDVDLRHVEHAQRDGGAEAEGDGQRGRLDVHLRGRSYRTGTGTGGTER